MLDVSEEGVCHRGLKVQTGIFFQNPETTNRSVSKENLHIMKLF